MQETIEKKMKNGEALTSLQLKNVISNYDKFSEDQKRDTKQYF